MQKIVNTIIGVVVVLAILSAMWTTISDFVTCITAGGGAAGALGALIPFFVILMVVLAIIYAAVKKSSM